MVLYEKRFPVPQHLRDLFSSFRELVFYLRKARWEKWRRVDPMAELFFDRMEKAPLLGFPSTVAMSDSVFLSGDVEIGEHVFIGQGCVLDGGGGLKIGHHTTISAGTKILTHDSARSTLTEGNFPVEKAPVSIGHHCYVGVNTTILKGVVLDAFTVVGAGAVVTKSFPSHSIIAGCPAKTIGRVDIHETSVSFCYDNNTRDIEGEPTA